MDSPYKGSVLQKDPEHKAEDWMLRRRKAVSDAETADVMRRLVEIFVEETRKDGYSFDWDPAFIHHLDNYMLEVAASDPPPDVKHSVIMGAGAFLGEMIVRHAGWSWSYDRKAVEATVVSPDGLIGYPHSKVAKRIEFGAEHNLEAFFTHALTNEAPHGTTARVYKPSWWRRLRDQG